MAVFELHFIQFNAFSASFFLIFLPVFPNVRWFALPDELQGAFTKGSLSVHLSIVISIKLNDKLAEGKMLKGIIYTSNQILKGITFQLKLHLQG